MATNQKMQLIRRERRLFSSSDDDAMLKQVNATHLPDGREFDVRPVLDIVEDILNRATPTIVVASQASLEVLEDRAHQGDLLGTLEALAFTIHRIACELSCKCSGGDAHALTMAVFNILGSYSWDAKVVLALAAFSVSYGEFWLTAQLYTVNPLAKSVALLKQVPDILEHTDSLKPRFDALNTLIKAALGVTKCIIDLKELPSEYISADTPAMATASSHIPTAVYWTIRSIVTCSSQIISLIGMAHEHMSSTAEAWELSSLAHKLSNIHGHLTKQLMVCLQHIDEKKEIGAYQFLVRLFEMVHIDNIKIIRTLIHSKDDLPLVDGNTKKRVSVEVLKRKIVLLFISDLDLVHEELWMLTQIYSDAAHQRKLERNYEVVWLPVIDRSALWTDDKHNAFFRLASTMPWYSLSDPTLLEPAVIKYIKEVWHFEKKPLLVVLDPQGKVVCPNALHMMWIWGALAFPFTSSREEALWKGETWRLEFLVDEIDFTLLQWIKEERFICLYGGEDLDWIRRFTKLMRDVAMEAGITIEMMYLGKSNPKERVKKNINAIIEEKLSAYLQDPTWIWYFWVRLESMWYSKMQQGRTIENDEIVQEVVTMLAFDGGNDGWAVISRGATEMTKIDGKKIVECLLNFKNWKESVEQDGFITALENALEPYHTHEHCTRLILPSTRGQIPENVVCAECKRPMEKYILYRCCTD